MTAPSRAADAADRVTTERDLVELVRTPSITGSEDAVTDVVIGLATDAGAAVERFAPDPADIRVHPGWPGEECPATRCRTSWPGSVDRAVDG